MEELENELAPNSSEAQGLYVPEADDEDRQEEAEEVAILSSALPIVEELTEWFDSQIEITDSVRQARITAKNHDTTLDNALIAHEIVAAILQTKRDEFVARFEGYLSNKDTDGE